MLDLNEQMLIRREKLYELQKKGKDPFEVTKFCRTHNSQEIKENFEYLDGKDVVVAGRIMTKRIMGKASFCTIQDMQGKLQSYVSINDLGEEEYKEFKTFDIGDIIGITGFVFKTKTEEIVSTIAQNVLNTTKINYQGLELDLSKGWKRIPMIEAIKEVTGIDFNLIKTDEEALKLVEEKRIEMPETKQTRGHVINAFFEEYVEETLIQPTFVIDYPVEVSPLTKRKPSDPTLVERFELFIGGREYANAYSELNDPIDQYERFLKQVEAKQKGDEEAGGMDEDFINALEIGLPPTGGLGIGLDRLIMLLTNSASIRDILFFPTMKKID